MNRTLKIAMMIVGSTSLLAGASAADAAAAEVQPAFIDADADWLTMVNYFREMSSLPPVTEDPALSAGAVDHSCYMLQNGISHDEVPGKTAYTAAGDEAGNNGNVAVSSSPTASAKSHIELWMTGPFHAIGLLRTNLQTVGFGMCADAAAPAWHSGATLDVLHGLGTKTPLTAPVLFPGNGTTTSLSKFVTESPDPLPYCGYAGTAGLPVIALMPETVTGDVSATITGPNGPVPTCALSQNNTDGTAAAILGADNGVVAIPKAPLLPGTYTVTVVTSARTVTWTFTVDPAAAKGPLPAATATPIGSAVDFTPLSPARVADTRQGMGATTLIAGVTKRIQISGLGGVAAGSTAVSANFTVVDPASSGYLTVWNCADARPLASTLNFTGGEVTPNAGTNPLDATGGLCVFSNVSIDLVVDVNGAYGPTGRDGFTSVTPARLYDTRQTGDRLSDGQTLQVKVAGKNGIPMGASAVALNVTGVDATDEGYVTVYPCGTERPVVSNLNPHPGRAQPNLVLTPVAADGTVCVYSLQDVDIVIDVSGYYKEGSGQRFTPSTPFRFTDTRERTRTELQAGTAGTRPAAGQIMTIQVAGVRGVPANVDAVSLNVTATEGGQAGFLTAWPCGRQPPTSTANYVVNGAISNGAQVSLSAEGTLCVFTQQAVHVVIDVNGWWS
jgi:hypothetical protein